MDIKKQQGPKQINVHIQNQNGNIFIKNKENSQGKKLFKS